ncbi:hypothetical protein Syun_009556 [Stephania yunnanensis]|uniref:Uncharacterized protein n=1 Tax=Stephania yunnanensis TaxID=152371 RepID=A0AAP0KH81_9MAGN
MSYAWSRSNPQVVHRGEARPTVVSVCESRSRRRGDPKLSQGGAGGKQRWRNRGRRAVVVACGGRNVEAVAELDEIRDGRKGGRSRLAISGAGGEDHAAAAASDDQLAGRRDPRCRRRALQRKDRASESRLTSTMIVDDDGDGGGKACAVTRLVRRWWQKMGLQREGSRKTVLVCTLF